ncbi:MAG: hypothetical protein NT011_11225 [Kiritimatiellaeota bacterium]|nr:hypothetical protein [Kiritimatiellota bacterium]
MTANNRIFVGLSCVAVVAAVILSSANLYLGDLNQDEGWYLYAAQLVASGQWPYVDFAFTQGPVMPLVYALFKPIITAGGLAGGRLITALLGLLAAVLAARLAARLVNKELRAGAALTTFILIGVNVYQSYFCTVVKTYSLTALLLMLGFLALAEGWTRRHAWLMLMAGAFMVLATGTRTSAGVVLPIVFIYLLMARHAPQVAQRSAPSLAWLHFGLGATVMAGLVFLPFLILAPESFLYCIMQYHALRHSGGGLMTLVFKVGFLSRLLQAYFVTFSIGVFVVFAKWALARLRPPCFAIALRDGERGYGGQARTPAAMTAATAGPTIATPLAGPAATAAAAATAATAAIAAPALMRILWLSIIAITLIHFLAPFPYDDYQVFVFPLLAIAIANTAIRLVGQRGALWLTIAILVVSLGAAGSSPLNQDWFIQGRDRIWWLVKDRSPLQKLRDTAAQIRRVTKPGDLLLTQDPYMAVEANLKVPRGLEMGQFSYFPALSDDQAAKLHVFNRAGFERLLRTTEAPLAALSGYALAIQSPDIMPVPPKDEILFWNIIREHYELMENVPNFGQAYTTLRIYRIKTAP